MTTHHPQMAWVVFSDDTDIRYLKCLKRGFRHCYVIMSDGEKWFSIDPLAHMTEIWLKSEGYRVVRVGVQQPELKPSPLMFMTCVESVKRMLGIQSRWVITPWQLYRHIEKEKRKTISIKKERIV